MDPVVSVIVPVYKVEAFLARAIESVFSQTFCDWEMILVDDGSPDRCGEICEEYCAKDERVRVIHKRNGGLSSARNAGLKIACGQYVYFLDSDDYLAENALEVMCTSAQEHRADIVMAGHDRVEPGGVVRHDYKDWDESSDVKSIRRRILKNELPNFAWGKLYKRELWKGLEFPEGVLVEDLYVVAKTFYRAENVWLTPQALYYYSHENEGSIMNGIGASYVRIRYGKFLGWREHEKLAQEKEPRDVELCVKNAVHALFRAYSMGLALNALADEEYKEMKNYLRTHTYSLKRVGQKLLCYLILNDWTSVVRSLGLFEQKIAERQQRRRQGRLYRKLKEET